eukprot:CCRYP_012174-RD/>CCRYP_012174-RD protein AED:0.45 eAED:0.45 QI:0/-1/0/1/-1/0/1/0/121
MQWTAPCYLHGVPCHSTFGTNAEYHVENTPVPRLCHDTPRHHDYLSHQQHDLAVHSDASYLSETKAHSRAGGHFFLSEDDTSPQNNGAVLTLAQIIKPVMSSAAEAKLGALYINAREVIPQ